jgi:hypothetical protein
MVIANSVSELRRGNTGVNPGGSEKGLDHVHLQLSMLDNVVSINFRGSECLFESILCLPRSKGILELKPTVSSSPSLGASQLLRRPAKAAGILSCSESCLRLRASVAR